MQMNKTCLIAFVVIVVVATTTACAVKQADLRQTPSSVSRTSPAGGAQQRGTAAAVPVVPPSPPVVLVAVTADGFVPNRIHVKRGVPTRLTITRSSNGTCAHEIVFADRDGLTELPMGKTVEIVYTSNTAGEVQFGCAMGMMVGGVLSVDN
jgi:hypothetical protein